MILNDLFESRMSDLDIQYQDWKNMMPAAFQSRYKMTKEQWYHKYSSLIPTEGGVHEGLRDPKDNPCWKGYKPVGTKKKAGKTVPNCVPANEEQLDELTFLGSQCTKDCSGHRAGYNWSKKRGGVDGMSPWSPSFNKGAALAKAGK